MKPFLTDSLSVILPTREETLLLRACLLPDEAGRAAWRKWQEQLGDPIQVLRADGQTLKRWLPLLQHSLHSNRVAAARPFQTLLRAAYLKEQLRCQAIRPIIQETVFSLRGDGIEPIVLRGIALADTVYPDPALRHCHDIDLLVRPMDLECLVHSGLTGLRPDRLESGSGGSLIFVHESGLPVQFHTRLFRLPYYLNPVGLWDKTSPREIAGLTALTLPPELSLLHICGHAACSPSRESLTWVCDSVSLIRAYPHLDWEIFSQYVVSSRLALPVSLMLNYLAGELDARIPEHVRERLDREAARTGSAGREAALHGARMTQRGNWRSLMRRTTGWRERMTIFSFLVTNKLHSPPRMMVS